VENKFNLGKELRDEIRIQTWDETYDQTTQQSFDEAYWPAWRQTDDQITRHIEEALYEK